MEHILIDYLDSILHLKILLDPTVVGIEVNIRAI